MIKIKSRKLKDIERQERKQKPKKGKVVRLTPDLVVFLEGKRRDSETVSETFQRILGQIGETRFVLPSDLHETIEEARGYAILRKVRTKAKQAEKPVKVKVP